MGDLHTIRRCDAAIDVVGGELRDITPRAHPIAARVAVGRAGAYLAAARHELQVAAACLAPVIDHVPARAGA